jgi:hypothetical protein
MSGTPFARTGSARRRSPATGRRTAAPPGPQVTAGVSADDASLVQNAPFVLMLQIFLTALVIGIVWGIPESLWLRARPETPAPTSWRWIPCLLAVVPASIGFWKLWQERLGTRSLALMLLGGHVGFSLGRWSAIDLRAPLLAAAGLAALSILFLALQSWKEWATPGLRRAALLWIWVQAVGLLNLFGTAVSDALAQTAGVALAALLLTNPITLGLLARACGAIPRWMDRGVRLGVVGWIAGAAVLWAVFVYTLIARKLPLPGVETLKQSAYNIALVFSTGGLALCLADRQDSVPWWKRALIPAAATLGGYLVLGERGSIAVLLLMALIVVAQDRGRSWEPLVMVFAIVTIGAVLVISIPLVRDRWLDFIGIKPIDEVERARVLPLAGWLGHGGAARPGMLAAWPGRDMAVAALTLNGGKWMALLAVVALAALVFSLSEAVYQLGDHRLRLLGAAFCALWMSEFAVGLGWLNRSLPFTGFVLAGIGRGVWALMAVTAVLAMIAAATFTFRGGKSNVGGTSAG